MSAGRLDKYRAVQAALALEAEYPRQRAHCKRLGISLRAFRAWSHRTAQATLRQAGAASLPAAMLAVALVLSGCASVSGGGGDKNFFRITGDDTGNVWINDAFVFPAAEPGMREVTLPPIVAPEGYADALKLSGVRRLRVVVPQLDGRAAAEDAVDINHCEEVELAIGSLWPGRTYCGTIKGGSRAIGIAVERQHGHGRETDWDYGNFSDQGNTPTRDCLLAVQADDRSPVRVRLLTAGPVTFPNAGVQGYAVDATAQGQFYPVFNFFKDLLRTFGVKI